MLDILTQERLSNASEKVLCSSEDYQSLKEEIKKANSRLETAGLSKEQNELVEEALSVANCSSAVYGAVAYKQGLCDGIKIMSEVRQIIQFENRSGRGVRTMQMQYNHYDYLRYELFKMLISSMLYEGTEEQKEVVFVFYRLCFQPIIRISMIYRGLICCLQGFKMATISRDIL